MVIALRIRPVLKPVPTAMASPRKTAMSKVFMRTPACAYMPEVRQESGFAIVKIVSVLRDAPQILLSSRTSEARPSADPDP